MCIVILSWCYHQDAKLVLCVNRDENFDRKTSSTRFWDTDSVILGAQDEKSGVQFAVTKNGRFAALTAYRELNKKLYSTTRGVLALNYLRGKQTLEELLSELQATAEQYAGYNLLFGTPDTVWYFSNRSHAPPRKLESGVYGLSNALLETQWDKVVIGTNKLRCIKDFNNNEPLFEILRDETPVSQASSHLQTQSSGYPEETEEKLGRIYVRPCMFEGKSFGTRAQHVFIVDYKGNAKYKDFQWNSKYSLDDPNKWEVHEENFTITSN